MSSIIIYSKNNCSYCKKAKELLNNADIPYDEILLDKEKDEENYIKTVTELKQKYNHHTFPFIIVNNKFLGGYAELEDAYYTLYLHKLLNLSYGIECDF